MAYAITIHKSRGLSLDKKTRVALGDCRVFFLRRCPNAETLSRNESPDCGAKRYSAAAGAPYRHSRPFNVERKHSWSERCVSARWKIY
ncbi:hypothetical protein EVAR_14997_1 [Eumeta japonica]|uniref:Uncharacterized protein n=1 Tax=Eumeta variegata TaxID=151549 RepID=A0A4C1X5G4_EUMVA|nr:hypothetical protein EVAR_14997_1 [Eumeta japonica]